MNIDEIIHKAQERLAEIDAERQRLQTILGHSAESARRKPLDVTQEERDALQRCLTPTIYREVYEAEPGSMQIDESAVETDIRQARAVVASFLVGLRVSDEDQDLFARAIENAQVMLAAGLAERRHPESRRVSGNDVMESPMIKLATTILSNAIGGARSVFREETGKRHPDYLSQILEDRAALKASIDKLNAKLGGTLNVTVQNMPGAK